MTNRARLRSQPAGLRPARFHGFGIHSPLREQRAVVETLARLEGPEARAALRRIVLSPGLPVPFQPAALYAAAYAGLVLPASFVDHDEPVLRGAAFDLTPAANVPAQGLRDGLSNGVASIRCAAAVALAHRGDASGRKVLVAALANTTSVPRDVCACAPTVPATRRGSPLTATFENCPAHDPSVLVTVASGCAQRTVVPVKRPEASIDAGLRWKLDSLLSPETSRA